MKKNVFRGLLLAAVSLALAMPAAAFTPYTPYTYDSYGHSTPSANGYEAETTVAVAERARRPISIARPTGCMCWRRTAWRCWTNSSARYAS